MRIASAAAVVLLVVLSASVALADNEIDIPLAPTNATLTSLTYTRGFMVRWVDSSNNESHFNISRRDANGNWDFLYGVGPDATSYTDFTIPSDITIGAYMISACNSSGCSMPAETNQVTLPMPGGVQPTPPPMTPPNPPPAPSIDLKVNGQTLLEQTTMQQYTVTWNSSGVQSCKLSWVNTDPPGNTGDDDVDPNVAGSRSDNDFATFTLACVPKGGGAVLSKSVSIIKKSTTTPPPPVVDIKFNNSDGPVTSTVGSMVKAGWTLQNVTSCQLVQTGPKPLSQPVSTTYWTDVLMTSSHVGTTVLTITCQKFGGGTISDSATLVVGGPTPPPPAPSPTPPPPVPAYSAVERELDTDAVNIQVVPTRPSQQEQFEQVGRDVRRFEQSVTAQQPLNFQETLNPTLAQPGITDSPRVVATVDALQERGGLGLYTDFDRDGVSDYDEIHLYGSDPRNAYTAGDVLTDGERIGRGLDVLSTSPERITVESPIEAGRESATIFEVVAIRTERIEMPIDVLPIASAPHSPPTSGPSAGASAQPVSSATTGTSADTVPSHAPTPAPALPPVAVLPSLPQSGVALVFEGRALPNSFVTLYIFSTPVVVTVKTDEAGNWKYALDRELEDGSHELYVAMVNNDGRIVAKSPPVPFVKQAEAVEFIPLLAPPITEPTLIDTLRNNLMVLGGLALFIFATVALGIVGLRRTEPPGAAA